jgi:hypothetical protein
VEAVISSEMLVNIYPDNINIYGNKYSSSTKGREFLDNMSDYQLLEYFTSWTWFVICNMQRVRQLMRVCVRATHF